MTQDSQRLSLSQSLYPLFLLAATQTGTCTYDAPKVTPQEMESHF